VTDAERLHDIEQKLHPRSLGRRAGGDRFRRVSRAAALAQPQRPSTPVAEAYNVVGLAVTPSKQNRIYP